MSVVGFLVYRVSGQMDEWSLPACAEVGSNVRV